MYFLYMFHTSFKNSFIQKKRYTICMSDDETIDTISFIRSPAKHGKYYVITIPNDYIKSGEIDPKMMYKVILKPLKKRK